MAKAAFKLALFFVGGHLLLSTVLLGVVATHGINDQDASFAFAMLYRCLNLPAVWALGAIGIGDTLEKQMILIFLIGIVQWACVAFAIAAISQALRYGLRAVSGRAARTSDTLTDCPNSSNVNCRLPEKSVISENDCGPRDV